MMLFFRMALGGNDGNPFFVCSLVVTILDPPGSEVMWVTKDIRRGHVICAFKSVRVLGSISNSSCGFSFLQIMWKAGYSDVGFNVSVHLNCWFLSCFFWWPLSISDPRLHVLPGTLPPPRVGFDSLETV